MNNAIKQIVIVGGGSAGWLVAGVLAAQHPQLAFTLVESPSVPPIGVGEGTWPSMRETLLKIGVSESDFLRECDGAFKQGSQFRRWVNGRDDDYYFHPFTLPQGYGEADLAAAWQARHANVPFADLVSHQPHLCAQGRAPKQASTPEYAAVANYGYHLDAGKFGVFLRKHCVERLKVRHVLAHITSVHAAENGDIAGVHTAEQGLVTGDLFIDCSGMQCMLLGGHYGVPFLSQKQVLFNDSALAVQVPYPQPDSPIASQTISTAQSSGWIWDIGLPTRRGIGHVYSSAHISDAQAENELRIYLQAAGAPDDIASPRKLSFQPGYRERFWHRNCVAIGLSSGFIEPLEASALALVELSVSLLSETMPADRATMDMVARRFNESFTHRWKGVIDFLKLHYVLSARRDSPFWIDNVAPHSIPEQLSELLAMWRHRSPSRVDFARIDEAFPSASYQYILYGMGFRTEPRAGVQDHADPFLREAAKLTAKMLPALPTNRALLAHIQAHGLPTI